MFASKLVLVMAILLALCLSRASGKPMENGSHSHSQHNTGHLAEQDSNYFDENDHHTMYLPIPEDTRSLVEQHNHATVGYPLPGGEQLVEEGRRNEAQVNHQDRFPEDFDSSRERRRSIRRRPTESTRPLSERSTY